MKNIGMDTKMKNITPFHIFEMAKIDYDTLVEKFLSLLYEEKDYFDEMWMEAPYYNWRYPEEEQSGENWFLDSDFDDTKEELVDPLLREIMNNFSEGYSFILTKCDCEFYEKRIELIISSSNIILIINNIIDYTFIDDYSDLKHVNGTIEKKFRLVELNNPKGLIKNIKEFIEQNNRADYPILNDFINYKRRNEDEEE
jgi:hypothetical protein